VEKPGRDCLERLNWEIISVSIESSQIISTRKTHALITLAMVFYTALFIITPVNLFPEDTLTNTTAVESIIGGLPVPEGSMLDEETYFKDDDGVEMAFYTHPVLTGVDVLHFYDRTMPVWGWETNASGSAHRSQRYYTKNGVPAIIGVDKKDTGSSFSILIGVTGDWGYMAPMRPEK
jgi:hypothetical protein